MSAGLVIHIHAGAPPKPPEGAPCNGCGVCCLLEPCPLGVLLTGRRRGACAAVQWDEMARHYRCAAVAAPTEALNRALPSWLHGASPVGAALLTRFAPRWIAAGTGCDSSVEANKGLSFPNRDGHRVASDG
ncbi:hypothetical protein [Rhodoferax sp.]|uniref:hypothetical protein n=1 Tax=Rhodoferax sp. TaxID=50421 RepID=UPI0027752B33|nr:hypothetical protein [Rhodoferax sp.]